MGVEVAATHSLPVQCITMFGLPQNHHDDDADDECDHDQYNYEDRKVYKGHTQPIYHSNASQCSV